MVVCGGTWSAFEVTEECYSITQFGNKFYAKMSTKRVSAAFSVLQGLLFVFKTLTVVSYASFLLNFSTESQSIGLWA